MFEVTLGEEGLNATWQDDFPETTKCVHCDGESRIGFVAFESPHPNEGTSLADLHKNDPHGYGYWPHECVAVAVYFCKKCLNPTALYNQA